MGGVRCDLIDRHFVCQDNILVLGRSDHLSVAIQGNSWSTFRLENYRLCYTLKANLMQKQEERDKNAEVPRQADKSHLRKDLLSPAEAKEEYRRRLTNVLPDLPALVLVVIMGGLGAALGRLWHLDIGETEFTSAVSTLSIWLVICLGSLGATVTVFLLAKTDTSKLIHCSLIAILSGMAGPYLVTKALSTVLSVNPNLVKVNAAITVVKSTTDTLERAIQTSTAEANPQKIIDVFDQTAQATTSYLSVVKGASGKEKQQALATSKQQLQDTLKALDAAATISPRQSLPLLAKVATEAKDAGVPEIAQGAQKIIDTNPAVRSAAETAAKSGKVYFITPEELTDTALHELHDRIKARFPLADLQPAVHPTRRMDAGLEVVYYRDAPLDKQIAEDLSKLVTEYLKVYKIAPNTPSVRKGSPDQPTAPFQFDIHIGPDVTSKLISNLNAGTPGLPLGPPR